MNEKIPLPQRLRDNAAYMADTPPATIETDSELWRTTIALQQKAAAALEVVATDQVPEART